MKKRFLYVVLLLFLTAAVQAQAPQQQQMKPEEVQRALDLVQSPQPVPDKYKAGFEAITAKDMLAVLAYLSSDWMEGRETGTRGYAMAADYAVSLFKLWGIKPGGDQPRAAMGRFMRTAQTAPAAPPERSYLQEFSLKEITDVRSSLTVEVKKGETLGVKTFEAGVDFMNMGRSTMNLSGPVVFIGYGIKEPSIGWDEFKGLNVKGKVVLVLSEAPGKDDPKSPFQQKKELKDKYFPAGPAMPMPPAFVRQAGGGRFNKLAEIAKLGPSVILVVQNTGKDSDVYNALSMVRQPSDDRPIVNRPRRRLTIPGAGPSEFESAAPTINITREIANTILGTSGQTIDDLKKKIESTYKPASCDLAGVKVTVESTAKVALVRTMNVIGYIEGSDPKLKDEVFVVGGHFDHLGRWQDYIYNGSDDNGSGSVGVMFIARALAMNPVKPKRTVVFCLWTGEEEGLLGSRYYTQNPAFPIAKTVGYLNYDMISRAFDQQTISRYTRQLTVPGAEELTKKIRAPEFVTVNLTKGTGFYELQKEMNKYVGLDLFMREAEVGVGGGGSDHSSFASVKVPYVYYMTAMHPDYHQTSDSVEKASGDLLAKVTRLGFLTVFAYADK